jgi:alkylation response protein AidB-like acyl-CoA dehydrogenase
MMRDANARSRPAAVADHVLRATEIAQRDLKRLASRWDENEEFPEETYELLRETGLIGMTVPLEYGGQGFSTLDACLVLEKIAAGCTATAMALQMNVNGPPIAISRLGDEAMKRRYLPGAADGSRYFAIAMTEPSAGSDGTALKTMLAKDGAGFRLSGEKCYITGGARADTFLVFCRADGSRDSRGIGAVVVERDAPGFAEPVVERKMGGCGLAEATLRFDDVPVTSAQILIPPEPESTHGAALLVRQFNPERCGNAAMCIGIAQAALDEALSYASAREQFGRAIIEFQGIQWKLADMALDIEAASLLLRKAAGSGAHDFPNTKSAVMAKLFANEMAIRVTNEALQIHGHRGYAKGSSVERLYRDARGFAVGGGTTEILRNILAAEVAGRRFSQRP